MKKLIGVMAALLLASCGGAGPDSGYINDKEYSANDDFLTAMASPWYILSPGMPQKPLDYPAEKWDPLTAEEKIMVHLEYYTPANVQKILDRVKASLTKSQNELSPSAYEKLIPRTRFDQAGDQSFTGVSFNRNPRGYKNFNPNEAMHIGYPNTGASMPIDFALFGEMLDQTYKIWEEYLRDYSNAPVDYVNFSVSEGSIRIGVNVGAEDRANYPLEKILAVTAQVEAYWHEASSYKTYEKHLQTLKTDFLFGKFIIFSYIATAGFWLQFIRGGSESSTVGQSKS